MMKLIGLTQIILQLVTIPKVKHWLRRPWDYVETENHPFELAVINPALVTGPSLSGDLVNQTKRL